MAKTGSGGGSSKLSPTAVSALTDALESLSKSDSEMPSCAAQAQFIRTDADGQMWVRFLGNDFETPVQTTSVTVEPGEVVNVEIANGHARIIENLSSPATTREYVGNIVANTVQALYGKFSTLEADFGEFGVLIARKASFEDLDAEHAAFVEMLADYATIATLEADYATIATLQANYASINYLQANYATISTLQADYATINSLNTNIANVKHLIATDAEIETMVANNVTVKGLLTANEADISTLNTNLANVKHLIATDAEIATLVANHATIHDLIADRVTTTELTTNYLTAQEISAGYAQVDLANVSNAWMTNGVINNAAISSAQIIGVSANKITAGALDAANIRVVNLDVANARIGTINGMQVGQEGITLDDIFNNVPTKDYLDSLESNLQNQIDGGIETWTVSAVPTLLNAPASSWTSNAIRRKHIGDICYVLNAGGQADGYCYRFAETSTNNFEWVLIRDSDITAVLQNMMETYTDAQGNTQTRIINVTDFKSQSASFQSSTNDALSTLRTNITSITTPLSTYNFTSFNDFLSTATGNFSTLTKLTDAVEYVEDSQGHVSVLTTTKNQVATLQTTANGLVASVNALTSTIGDSSSGLVHDYATLSSTVSGFSSRVGTIESTVSNNDANNPGIIQRLTTAETNIAQLPNQITLSASATSSVATNPNLAPFFEGDFPTSGSSNGIWSSLNTSYFTQLTNGWAHLECDRSTATSNLIIQMVHSLAVGDMYPNTQYTFLVEIRNATVSGPVYVYVRRSDDAYTGRFLSGTTNYFAVEAGSSVRRLVFTTKDTTDFNAANCLVRSGIQVGGATSNPAASISMDIRVSLYQNGVDSNNNSVAYVGNWKPHVSKKVYSTQAEISVKANKDTLTSEINATADTVKINANRLDVSGIMSVGSIPSTTDISSTYATKAQAQAVTQRIYRSSTSASNVPAIPTSWVTENRENQQNKWTLSRPQYSSTYPVLFSATQYKFVDSSLGVQCSTPTIDNTLTVIDGAHIITGSIDANKINVSNLISVGSLATSGDIPTKTSDLTNDSSFATTSQLPTKTSDLTNDSNFVNSSTAAVKSQTIYCSRSTGAAQLSPKTNAWVTASTGQNTWCTVRPVYSSSYPKVFRATQTMLANGTIQCTDPVEDAGMTVIDGGRITTGVVAAQYVDVSGIIQAARTSDLITDSKPNLSPFFQAPFTAPYWEDYNSHATIKGGGWAHVAGTNSGDSAVYYYFYIRAVEELQPNTQYTVLVELENITVQGGSVNFRVNYNSDSSSATALRKQFDTNTTAIGLTDNNNRKEYQTITTKASFNGCDRMGVPYFLVNAGATFACDVRVSIFEGSYEGSWKQYTGGSLYSTVDTIPVKNGYTIHWNYESYSSANAGEAYICAKDPVTNSESDANGYVMWNGVKRTVPKQMINPNTVLPYNVPVYIVLRLASASDTTGTVYMVWYDTEWKYATTPTPTAVGGSWTWVVETDIILGRFVEPGSEKAFTDCVMYDPPLTRRHISVNTSTASGAADAAATAYDLANQANTTANNATPKTEGVKEAQQIYCRSSSTTAPSAPTSWITSTSTNPNAEVWTRKPLAYDSTNKYRYTCTQYRTSGGNVFNSTVILDATITVIDGGSIITSTIAANSIAAGCISVTELSAFGATIGGFTIDTTSIRTAAATSNADNSIALSTADFTRTILSTSRSGLRFAIGDKFAVTGDGVLYTKGQYVTNLDASNITTGTLSADLIAAGSLSVGKLDTAVATQAAFEANQNSVISRFAALQAASGNLLVDISAPSLTKIDGPAARWFGTAQTGVTATWEELPDSPCAGVTYGAKYVITASSAADNAAAQSLVFYNGYYISLKKGVRYRVGAWFKASKANRAAANFYVYKESATLSGTNITKEITVADTWIHHYADFVPSADCNVRVYYRPRTKAQAVTVYIAGFYLVEGGQESIIRQDSNGVIVSEIGAATGAVVRSGGTFTITKLTWADDVPTLGYDLLKIENSQITFKNSSNTTLAQFKATGVNFYDDAGTSVAWFGRESSSYTARVGASSGYHVTAYSNKIVLANSTDTLTEIGPSTITLGKTSSYHNKLTSSGIEIKNNADVLMSLSSGSITLGSSSTTDRYMVLDSSGLNFRRVVSNTEYYEGGFYGGYFRVGSPYIPYQNNANDRYIDIYPNNYGIGFGYGQYRKFGISLGIDDNANNTEEYYVDLKASEQGNILISQNTSDEGYDQKIYSSIELSTLDFVGTNHQSAIKLQASTTSTTGAYANAKAFMNFYSGIRSAASTFASNPQIFLGVGARSGELQDWITEVKYVTSSSDIKYIVYYASGLIHYYRRWAGTRNITTANGSFYTNNTTYTLNCGTYGMADIASVEVFIGTASAYESSETQHILGVASQGFSSTLNTNRLLVWAESSLSAYPVWIEWHVIGYASGGVNSIV